MCSQLFQKANLDDMGTFSSEMSGTVSTRDRKFHLNGNNLPVNKSGLLEAYIAILNHSDYYLGFCRSYHIITLACFCHPVITWANSLNPDQARHNVKPDLLPNCLTVKVAFLGTIKARRRMPQCSTAYFLISWQKHNWAVTWDVQQCGMCDQQRLRSACAYAQSNQSIC